MIQNFKDVDISFHKRLNSCSKKLLIFNAKKPFLTIKEGNSIFLIKFRYIRIKNHKPPSQDYNHTVCNNLKNFH